MQLHLFYNQPIPSLFHNLLVTVTSAAPLSSGLVCFSFAAADGNSKYYRKLGLFEQKGNFFIKRVKGNKNLKTELKTCYSNPTMMCFSISIPAFLSGHPFYWD